MVKKESKSDNNGETHAPSKDNAPVVRREIFNLETLNVLLTSIILVLLLVGYGSGTGSSSSSGAGAYDVDACRAFCEYNPTYGTGSYAGLSGDGHCLCSITVDGITNYAMNKTMSATVIIDQGIIVTDTVITDGVPEISDSSIYYDTG